MSLPASPAILATFFLARLFACGLVEWHRPAYAVRYRDVFLADLFTMLLLVFVTLPFASAVHQWLAVASWLPIDLTGWRLSVRLVLYVVLADLALLAVASRLAPREASPGRGPIALAALVALGGGVFHLREAWATSRSFEAIDARAAATWLARNSRPGDEVFLPDYGAFPRLFYSDRRNVYTLGLDPAFLRALDPGLYGRYLDAVRLERDPYPLVARTLGARYVYVENTTNGRPFHAYLVARRDRYRPVYQDAFASVFEVRPPAPSFGSPAR